MNFAVDILALEYKLVRLYIMQVIYSGFPDVVAFLTKTSSLLKSKPNLNKTKQFYRFNGIFLEICCFVAELHRSR